MRRFAVLCCCAAAVVGCAKSEPKAPAASPTPPPPPAISLADLAGKWTVRGMNEARDTTLVTYELNASPARVESRPRPARVFVFAAIATVWSASRGSKPSEA